MDVIDLPDRLRSIVDREITAGETVRWIAQPDASRFGCVAWIPMLIGIPFTGFALFWMALASGFGWVGEMGGGGLFTCFSLFGIPFVLVGVGLLTSPYWMARVARSSVYLITDRRAVIITALWNVNVRSFTAKNLNEFRRTERPDGYGNVIFQRFNCIDSDRERRMHETGFYGIANPKEVEDLLRDLARKS